MESGDAGGVVVPAVRHGRAWLQRIAVALPLFAALTTPLFARAEPRLLGMPFFHWYQFAWVPLTAACLAVAYLADRRGSRGR